jgi:hypothetical protein
MTANIEEDCLAALAHLDHGGVNWIPSHHLRDEMEVADAWIWEGITVSCPLESAPEQIERRKSSATYYALPKVRISAVGGNE